MLFGILLILIAVTLLVAGKKIYYTLLALRHKA